MALKMVSKCFKSHNVSQLLFLTGAATEVDLPNIWSRIAEGKWEV